MPPDFLEKGQKTFQTTKNNLRASATFLEVMFSSFCPNEKTITLPLLAGTKKICTLVKISLTGELNLSSEMINWFEKKKGNLIYIFFQIFLLSLKRVGNVDRGYAGGISNSLSGENEFKTMKKEKILEFFAQNQKELSTSVYTFATKVPFLQYSMLHKKCHLLIL